MAEPSLSFEELEALHDVLEAARCYWNQHPLARQRASEVLRTVNRLYWRLGEELPKTGTPSERFSPVMHSSEGSLVDQILNFTMDLSREFANAHDPWWADTVLISEDLAGRLSGEEFIELEGALERLGMILLLEPDLADEQVAVDRRDFGPWPELAVR